MVKKIVGLDTKMLLGCHEFLKVDYPPGAGLGAVAVNTLTAGVCPKLMIWVWGSSTLFMSGQISEKHREMNVLMWTG